MTGKTFRQWREESFPKSGGADAASAQFQQKPENTNGVTINFSTGKVSGGNVRDDFVRSTVRQTAPTKFSDSKKLTANAMNGGLSVVSMMNTDPNWRGTAASGGVDSRLAGLLERPQEKTLPWSPSDMAESAGEIEKGNRLYNEKLYSQQLQNNIDDLVKQISTFSYVSERDSTPEEWEKTVAERRRLEGYLEALKSRKRETDLAIDRIENPGKYDLAGNTAQQAQTPATPLEEYVWNQYRLSAPSERPGEPEEIRLNRSEEYNIPSVPVAPMGNEYAPRDVDGTRVTDIAGGLRAMKNHGRDNVYNTLSKYDEFLKEYAAATPGARFEMQALFDEYRKSLERLAESDDPNVTGLVKRYAREYARLYDEQMKSRGGGGIGDRAVDILDVTGTHYGTALTEAVMGPYWAALGATDAIGMTNTKERMEEIDRYEAATRFSGGLPLHSRGSDPYFAVNYSMAKGMDKARQDSLWRSSNTLSPGAQGVLAGVGGTLGRATPGLLLFGGMPKVQAATEGTARKVAQLLKPSGQGAYRIASNTGTGYFENVQNGHDATASFLNAATNAYIENVIEESGGLFSKFESAAPATGATWQRFGRLLKDTAKNALSEGREEFINYWTDVLSNKAILEGSLNLFTGENPVVSWDNVAGSFDAGVQGALAAVLIGAASTVSAAANIPREAGYIKERAQVINAAIDNFGLDIEKLDPQTATWEQARDAAEKVEGFTRPLSELITATKMLNDGDVKTAAMLVNETAKYWELKIDPARPDVDSVATAILQASKSLGAKYSFYGEVMPQNVDTPNVPLIELSTDTVAQANGGTLPQRGNYLRKTFIERAVKRLGLDSRSEIFIPVENVTRNGDEYMLQLNKNSIAKMLSPDMRSSQTIPIESLAVLENLERIAANGVYVKSEPDRKGRDQIRGFDYLRTFAYIDGAPYEINMRVKLVRAEKGADGKNNLYYFTPEEITLAKTDAASPTRAVRDQHLKNNGEAAPVESTASPTGAVRDQHLRTNGEAALSKTNVPEKRADVKMEESGSADASAKAERRTYTRQEMRAAYAVANDETAPESDRTAARKVIRENAQRARQERNNEIAGLFDTVHDWKDKKRGLAYSSETMERNIRDIVPNAELAQKIIDTLFTPVHASQAEANRFLNEYRDRVRALGLARKKHFDVEVDGRREKVSQSGLVQLYGEGKLSDAALRAAGADVKKIKIAAAEMRTIYNELFEQIDSALIANGYPPVGWRENYFPHFSDKKPDRLLAKLARKLGFEAVSQDLPTNIAGITHIFRPGKQWFGNLLHRMGDTTDYDAVLGFDRYVQGAANVIFQTENIQRLRAAEAQIRYLGSDESVQAKIDEIRNNDTIDEEQKTDDIEKIWEKGPAVLPNFVTELRTYTDLLAGKKHSSDRSMEYALGRASYTTMKNLEGRIAANMVAVNPSSWLTNFIPLTQARTDLSYGALLRAARDTVMANGRDDNFALTSDFLTNRRGSDAITGTATQKATDFLSKPMSIIDNFTANVLVRAKYEQNIEQGMSEERAMREADQWAAGLMADRSKGSMPTLFERRNPFAKIATMFQLEVNNQFRYFFKDVPRAKADKGMRAIAGALLKAFVDAYLFNDLFELLVGRRPALDPIGIVNDLVGDAFGVRLDNVFETAAQAVTGGGFEPAEHTQRRGAGETISRLGENVAQEIPFVGGYLGGGRFPVSSALPDFAALKENVSKLADGDGTNNKRALANIGKEFSKPAYYLLPPVGGGQLKKAVEGISTVARGGYYGTDSEGNDFLKFRVDQTPGNYVKGALFGRYALGGAQEYIDSNFKYLTAKQTKVYEAALKRGLDGELVFDLLMSMKGLKNNDQRRAVIAASGFKAADKAWLDEQLLTDGVYLPKEVKADYSSPDALKISIYGEETYEKYLKAEKSRITAEQFLRAYEAQRGIEGDGTQYSASRAKKEAIDRALPAMSQERRRVLYELFGVSKKVW